MRMRGVKPQWAGHESQLAVFDSCLARRVGQTDHAHASGHTQVIAFGALEPGMIGKRVPLCTTNSHHVLVSVFTLAG